MKGIYVVEIRRGEKYDEIAGIYKKIEPSFSGQIIVEQFHEEDEGVSRIYNVYKISDGRNVFVLKKSDKYEENIYKNILRGKELPVPKFYGSVEVNEQIWILIEYITGKDLRVFDGKKAEECADSLSKIFNSYWQQDNFEENMLDERFERYWKRINKRAECLRGEPKLNAVYDIFLKRQLMCPRTLCCGDFLQCNAVENEDGVFLIDWGFGGIMPYSLDIARLIIHGSEKYFPFPYYMTDEYRKIFVEKLYSKLEHKPDYDRYIKDIVLSCLNECIEFMEEYLVRGEVKDECFDFYHNKAIQFADLIIDGEVGKAFGINSTAHIK